jgi:hypothetical protein
MDQLLWGRGENRSRRYPFSWTDWKAKTSHRPERITTGDALVVAAICRCAFRVQAGARKRCGQRRILACRSAEEKNLIVEMVRMKSEKS